jgi:hypothetical protein
MTKIVYFSSSNHEESNPKNTLKKLKEFKPDLLTLETSPEFSYWEAIENGLEPRDCYIDENSQRVIFRFEDNSTFGLRSNLNEEYNVFVKYALANAPLFFVDTYRTPIDSNWKNICKKTAICGILPNGRITNFDFGKSEKLLTDDNVADLITSNYLMAHNINNLAKIFKPKLIVHLGGSAHYFDKKIPHLQDLVRCEPALFWDTIDNKEIV